MNRLAVFVLIASIMPAFAGSPASAAGAVSTAGTVSAAGAVDVRDAIGGSPFRIQIPENWNGNLVMYAHGYAAPGRAWNPLGESMSGVFLSRGFALAESGYSRQGWAVEQALAETETLRQHFCGEYGEPDSTFVFGFSMGGLITLATIERYPDAYEGALPMCGPLLPSYVFFKERVFDVLVTFEALFGKSIQPESRPVVEAAALSAQAVEQALSADSAMADDFAAHWGIRRTELPAILSMNHLLLRELAERAGGNPFDNRNTVYSGFDRIPALNDIVPRYEAVEGAVEYIRTYYTPTAGIKDPVLALHTTYDPGVPPFLPGYYSSLSTLEGNGRLFVQKYVQADGHCAFTSAQVGAAFDELRGWAATGVSPRPGSLE